MRPNVQLNAARARHGAAVTINARGWARFLEVEMMRFDDFLNALTEAGWKPVGDAQHEHIRALWERMFPVLAAVEKELSAAECRLDDLGEREG